MICNHQPDQTKGLNELLEVLAVGAEKQQAGAIRDSEHVVKFELVLKEGKTLYTFAFQNLEDSTILSELNTKLLILTLLPRWVSLR